MTNIKAGMYRGDNPVGIPVSLDPKRTRVPNGDGKYIDVASLEYTQALERQILELKQSTDILTIENKAKDTEIKRLWASIGKLNARQR